MKKQILSIPFELHDMKPGMHSEMSLSKKK
jgi:hypothetical protein